MAILALVFPILVLLHLATCTAAQPQETEMVRTANALFSYKFVNPTINYTADCETFTDCFNCTISQCFWNTK